MKSHFNHINNVLAEIGKRDQIANLKLGHELTCALVLRNGIKLFFEYAEEVGKLCIYMPLNIALQHEAHDRDLLEILLSFNFLSLQDDEGTIALCSDTKEIVYQIVLEAETLSVAKMDTSVGGMIRQGEDIVSQALKNRVSDASMAAQASKRSASATSILNSRMLAPAGR